jgi:gluconolactonase
MRPEAAALALAALCAAAIAHAQPIEEFAFPASYPEGAYWSGEKFYFTEMGADRVDVLDDGARRWFFRQPGCGPTAIAPYGEGFLVLCHLGARVVAVDAEGRELRRWETDQDGSALRDPNDAVADGQGGVYFTDPGPFSRAARAQGYVMHLSPDGELKRAAGPLWYPNGVCVDPSGRHLLVSEHMTGRILRFDISADFTLDGRRILADIDRFRLPSRYRGRYAETGPDGLEFGPDGNLYVAIYGAGRILRITPNGALAGHIETPARFVTNLSFDDSGGALTTGVFENMQPPFPGEVRYFPPARLTPGPD